MKRKVIKKPAKKKVVKSSAKKAKPTSTLKRARVMIDESLSSITPALKASLDEVKSQLTVGDLRSLGLRVFERAKTISDKVRSQAPAAKSAVKPSVKKPVKASKKKASSRK